jgi:superfamily II DNA/RNA helicase
MADPTFITNEGENTLEKLFKQLIKNTKFFDCLVGYFYPSGFFRLYKELESVEKIRILIGIGTNQHAYDMLSRTKSYQLKLNSSSTEIKKELDNKIIAEYENSKENEYDIEEGTKKFIEWINSGKLEIKAYPDQNVHAKLYIFTSKGGGFGDDGRVISGSSNLTESGLNRPLEFNHILKNKEDYDYALNHFENLWKSAIEVSDRFVQTIRTKTWMNPDISPYHLFLKFLYEYLRERIDEDLVRLTLDKFRPKNFIEYKYQTDAVKEAREKLQEYGGVFIADVVGLGKTYIATMLAKEFEAIDGINAGTLVIAPPVLLDENNPGSWRQSFYDFNVRGDYCSRGKLEEDGIKKAKNARTIIIDESHGFRNESTQMYEHLFRICKGKRVILVSATPLNNTPLDILAQLKLFQNVRKSTFPNPAVRDLEAFFKKLQARLNGVDRQENKDEYISIIQENAKEIKQKVLKYVMIRRTRGSIIKYYGEDLKKQGLKFPAVEDPQPIIYQFDEKLDRIFNKTLDLIINQFHYSRYKPLTYLNDKSKLSNLEKGSQANMGSFMKGVLLKRLESSFYAFKNSIHRFIQSYELFIKAYNGGHVYLSKGSANKILECIESDDAEQLQWLLDNEKAKDYPKFDEKGKENFDKSFLLHLEEDLKILKEIENDWKKIDYDPKLDEFKRRLNQDIILKKNKIVIFTESKETAEYLEQELIKANIKQVQAFSSSSEEKVRKEIIENFDARNPDKKTIRILITTDILAEGVNLHRSNVVMNYDIPWNPTKMMQRVGRINRVDSKHDTIYTYNFFPAGQINENVKLTESAEAKIKAFIEMLGNDARLLTDEEIKSHDLFVKLNSSETLTNEGESDDIELKWLIFLRNLRDNHKELYGIIKKLPKKARTSKKSKKVSGNGVITFFRKGKLKKIFITTEKDKQKELDLSEATEVLECTESTKSLGMEKKYYDYLEANKEAFDEVFEQEVDRISGTGTSNEYRLITYLKTFLDNKRHPNLTDEDTDYIQEVMQLINGEMDAHKTKALATALIKKKETNEQKVLAILKDMVNPEYFEKNPVNSADISGPKEVILSEYIVEEKR